MSPFEESWRSASTTVQDKEERRILFATLDSFRSVSVFFYSVPLLGLSQHRLCCFNVRLGDTRRGHETP